jgi:predicted ATPase
VAGGSIAAVSANPPAANHAATWRIELLGQLRATSGDRVITQFGSRKVAALLARLALFPKRAQGREELIDLLWPDADLDTGRNRLRQALFALRRLLEPPGAAEVLVVDRSSVRLNAACFTCDASDFEACVRSRDMAGAQALYVGELLPGHYDEWIDEERARLQALADRAAASAGDDGGDRGGPRDPGGAAAAAGADSFGAHPDGTAGTAAASPPAVPGMRLQATQTSRPDRQELLPAYVARFFGREAELAQLAQMLQQHRLITLLGPGGSGKTRLAAEAARRQRQAYAVVAFVALAECSRPDELPARLRAALRLPDSRGDARTEGQGDATEQLKLYLHARPALLVLDNFEQLVAPGGAQVLEQLLMALPKLHLLVSSRRVLDVEGERSMEVPPLPLPGAEDDLAAFAANPSVALFVDRAQGARAGFHLNARNRADVQALCAALEGVPLAIELAASRAHALSVADMRAQMDEHLQAPNARFALLARKGPRAARAPRHASLDAAIDWSWQLLSEQDQRGLAALSVFREGFSAEAAAVVWQQPNAQDALARLVADSLLRSELGQGGDMRYRLFEMVREFVAERLGAEERLALRARQRAWCLQLAKTHGAMLPLADLPNLHEALRTGLEDGQPLQTLALALATESHWERRGVPPEVRTLWLAALDDVRAGSAAHATNGTPPLGGPTPHDDPQVHAARCLFARRIYEAGDAATAMVLADEAVAAAGSDNSLLAKALAVQLRLRWKNWPRGDEGMSDAVRRALVLTQGGDTLRTRAELLNLLGEVMVLGRNDAQAALPYYAEALGLYESLGEQRLAWDVRMGQGICAQVQRRFDDAIAMHTAVAEAAARLDDQLLLIDAYNNLAVACNHAHRWDQAVQHGRKQLQLATRQYSRYMQVMALWNLAKPLARSRQPHAAATALAASQHEWLIHFGPLAAGDLRYVAKVRRLVRWQLGTAPADAVWAAGEALALADAVKATLDAPAPVA